MKLCRFQPQIVPSEKVGTNVHPGVLQGVLLRDVIQEVTGDICGKWTTTNRSWPLQDIKLLTPVVPSKIVCVGINYVDHGAEFGAKAPAEPIIFLKPPSALLAPGDSILVDPKVRRTDYEGELAVVMGKECYQLREGEDVKPYVAGYTCLNDVSARDFQSMDGQWTRAKAFDTFCPLGPVIETEFDAAHAHIATLLNGERKQYSALTAMVFSVDVIIRWVSQIMTLLPGDVIATGTPSGVGPMKSGDIVEIVIDGIGTLRNPVMNRSI